MYLNIASFLFGKQLTSTFGSKSYLSIIFICVHLNQLDLPECRTMRFEVLTKSKIKFLAFSTSSFYFIRDLFIVLHHKLCQPLGPSLISNRHRYCNVPRFVLKNLLNLYKWVYCIVLFSQGIDRYRNYRDRQIRIWVSRIKQNDMERIPYVSYLTYSTLQLGSLEIQHYYLATSLTQINTVLNTYNHHKVKCLFNLFILELYLFLCLFINL